MPDTFFRNEKEARKHEIIVPNVYVRIFPDGEILYSIRISLTLACPMDLRLYPLDKQVCALQIASYGWAKDDLIYKWKEKDPVQVVPNIHLPRFDLVQYKSDYCDVFTNTGEYSCLKVELIFKREFSYYLITIYVPCCMLVIVSWVSFWLDQNAIPARVSLGVTTLLTMSTQASGINAQLPPVSYTKAIDVWTGVCQTFVFCALLEFALVNYASRSDMQRDRARERMERARRQWELENAAEMEAAAHDAAAVAAQAATSASGAVTGVDPTSASGTAGGVGNSATTSTSATAAATSTAATVTVAAGNAVTSAASAAGGKPNGNPRTMTANHIEADGAPPFTLKKRLGGQSGGVAGSGDIFGTSNSLRNPYGDYNSEPHYRSTTSYPHPHPQSPDQFTDFPGVAGYGMPSAAAMGGSSGSMAYMLSANDPTNMRTCEVHMNSFGNIFGSGGGGGPESGNWNGTNPCTDRYADRYGGSHEHDDGRALTASQRLVRFVITLIDLLFCCCRGRGVLTKFPSRAKRIDVISRFIFPMIFAIFNLAYWLYYLFAKSNFPELQD